MPKHLQTTRPSSSAVSPVSLTPCAARSTPRFLAQSATAASSASAPMTEQWIFCCGRPSRKSTMSLFWIFSAWIGVSPWPSISAHSASDAAMAEVQPNVRYLASTMTSCSGSAFFSTRNVNFRASPHTIEPCWPTPSAFSISPRCVPGLPCTASMKIRFVFSLYSQAIAVVLSVVERYAVPGVFQIFRRGRRLTLGFPAAVRAAGSSSPS